MENKLSYVTETEVTPEQDFMDDCVAMVEVFRCLKEKGALLIDDTGILLQTDVFDRLFPEAELVHNDNANYDFKRYVYRGFPFECAISNE